MLPNCQSRSCAQIECCDHLELAQALYAAFAPEAAHLDAAAAGIAAHHRAVDVDYARADFEPGLEGRHFVRTRYPGGKAELGIVGAAVGAALSGMRPIVEIQFSDFTAQAMDQIANQAAKIHFMLGGALHVPMVLRTPQGSGTGAAAQHSQNLEPWFASVPGLKVVVPSNPADAKGLLLSSIDDPNPVIFLEHKLVYNFIVL